MPDTSGGQSTIRRRRLLAAAGGAGLTVGLAGCSLGRSNPSEATVVQLAATSAEKEIQSDINKVLHQVGLPSDVQVEILPGDGDLAQSQFSQWLSADLDRPSLLRMDSGWTIPFILRDQVVNLSKEMSDVASNVKENYFEATVSSVTGPEGDVYGVPMFADFGLMLYRKDLIENAGHDTSNWATSPITWKKFATAVRDAKQNAGTAYGFTFQGMVYEGLSCCTFPEFMCSWGGSYFGARKNLLQNVGTRPVTVDEDPTIRANRMVRTFLRGDDPHALDDFPGNITPAAISSWDEDPSLSPFAEGDAIAHRNWPYAILETGVKDAFGENLGVMPMPYGVPPDQAKYDGMGGSISALGGWHITLNPNAKYETAAKEVLRALTAKEFNMLLFKELGYLPPKPAMLDSKAARNVEAMGRYVDTIRFAGEHALPRPVTVVWPQQSPRMAQQVSASLTGEKPPKKAMTDLRDLLADIEQAAKESRNQ